MKRAPAACILGVLFLTFSAAGQPPAPRKAGVPIYDVTVIERSTKAVNYQYRSGPTAIDMRGTVLMPGAKGSATVESKRGRTEIDLEVSKLAPPTRFGREYLTYTLWAITPEGAPHNIGEVIPNGSDKAKMHVTTDLQAFGLVVTAEPYSASRQPSDVVVLENQVRPDTAGKIEEIQVNYELMPRGHYIYDAAEGRKADAANAPKVSMGRYEAMLEMYEAQNALGIARSADAGKYAPQTLQRAEDLLAEARRLDGGKADSNRVVQAAREAAQTAEDARAIAEKRLQEEKLAAMQAQAARTQGEQARAEAEIQRLRAEADSARAEAERERTARTQAETDATRARQEAEVAAVPAPPPRPPAPAARDEADTHKELRMRLLEQLRGLLPARDTPRGLVLTVAESSFSGNELRAGVSGRIGQIAAILQAYPQLRLVVEGYSDGIANETQARRRAEGVRQTLVAHGWPAGSAAARGLGDSRPLVANTSTGREQNRRVEIVITGDPIGTVAYWDRTYSLIPER